MSLRIKDKGKWVAVDIDCSLRSDKLTNERAINLIGDITGAIVPVGDSTGFDGSRDVQINTSFAVDAVAPISTKLETARNIGLSGVTATAQPFDGTADITIPVTEVPVSLLTGVLPLNKGGTGATTAEGVLTNLGITATIAELNFVDGVTSSIQEQLNSKAAINHASADTSYGVGSATNYGHVKAATDVPLIASGTGSVGTDNGLYARADHVHPEQINITGNAASASKLETARTISISGGATAAGIEFNGTNNVPLIVTSLDATLLTGLVPKASIPQSALPTLVIVENQEARYALTTSQVKLGDTVKQTDTQQMFYVVDVNNLNNEEGYEEFTTGAVSWNDLLDKPSTFTPSAHTHTLADITDYEDELPAFSEANSGQILSVSESGTLLWKALSQDVNYYPTAFSWTDGSATGPTGSLTGIGMAAVSFPAIPSASATVSGIVTTGEQTFAGKKQFNNPVVANTFGYIHALGEVSGATTVDFGTVNSNVVSMTVTAATSLTLTAVSGITGSQLVTLIITNGGSNITWPDTISWPFGTAPTLATSGTDVIQLVTVDNGTTWYPVNTPVDDGKPNITVSTKAPTDDDGEDGDIWIQYTPSESA